MCNGIVQNKYADNPGKRAAWLAAIHVEKARRPQRRSNMRAAVWETPPLFLAFANIQI